MNLKNNLSNINDLVYVLNSGGIAVIPTDTVYGIVCDALNYEAVSKIYTLKKRNPNKPMIILVSNIEMVKRYAYINSYLEEDIIKNNTPGPLTIILKKKDTISNIVTSNKDEVAVRIPDDLFLQKLITKLDKPIVATSANIAGSNTITKINELDNSIKDNVDYLIDCGYCNREASTIIKIVDEKIFFIRKGSIANNIISKYSDKII